MANRCLSHAQQARIAVPDFIKCRESLHTTRAGIWASLGADVAAHGFDGSVLVQDVVKSPAERSVREQVGNEVVT